MTFDVLTLFPEMIKSIVSESIIGRAIQNGYLTVNCVQIRDFSSDKHRRVDDYPYGGGDGMVMQPEPIWEAYQSVLKNCEEKPRFIYLSPQGKLLTQELAKELSKEPRLVLLCGHYEGVDERVLEMTEAEEISIGNYVLTGGELPAAILIDAVGRMVPGVLAADTCFENESLYDGLLEYPQYTRPPEYMGYEVPEILREGHHKKIEEWRLTESLKRTLKKRPELLEGRELTKEESKILESLKADN